MSTAVMDFDGLISDRARAIDVSGIRRVFELGAKLRDPINLSIGQPDFPVPEPIKKAAMDAVTGDRNGYTLTQGAPDLLAAVRTHLRRDVGWEIGRAEDDLSAIITAGTSGAILLAFLAAMNPGDEAIIPDPYFVIYPAMGQLTGGRIVPCNTYPNFRMTAERIEPLLTERTKIVLVNSPGNPTGVVLTAAELRELADLCERRGVLLISDEIYDEFTYSDVREDGRCPSPARFTSRMLLIRGFGKTYGCTGWRLGYAAGPTALIRQMAKLQQYTFVCAPSPLQAGVVASFDVDMAEHVAAYQRKRDMVLKAMDGVAEVVRPGGAFYAFIRIPPHLGLTATQFVERAIERNVLAIPGAVFSSRDTHLRISYAVADDRLQRGLTVLREMMSATGPRA